MIAVQKSCIHASAVAVFVEWWMVVFVDIVSFHRGICTLGAIFFAADKEEHDLRLRAVLNRMAEAGTALNMEKCLFQQTELKFLGHVLNQDGVSPDPEKTRAIALMPAPDGVPALRRFLGMVNHLGKFSHRLSELTKPLRDLLSAKNSWSWGPDQDRAFQEVKKSSLLPQCLLCIVHRLRPKFLLIAHHLG